MCWSKGDSESWKDFTANPRLDLPEQSITALSFAPIKIIDKYLLAAGFESGVIHVYTMDVSCKESCWNLEIQLDNRYDNTEFKKWYQIYIVYMLTNYYVF